MTSVSAQSLVVRGRVVDAATASPVKAVSVRLTPADEARADALRETRSADDGRFEFEDVRAGRYIISAASDWGATARQVILIDRPVELVLVLEIPAVHQEHVTVSGLGQRDPDTGGRVRTVLESPMLQDMRSIATDDPMRVMQTLPGAATGDDFQAELSVRGSAFRQMGIVIDGTAAQALLHAVHAVDNPGSIAMVNTDTLARASLLAGPHTARHGDWLGATLEFDVREGSRVRASAGGLVSGTAVSIAAEGPIARGRGSWLVSLRRSYLDWLIQKLEPTYDSAIGFYDGVAKATFDLTPQQQVEVLVMGGDARYRQLDATAPNSLQRATSGSTLASAAWRRSSAEWLLSVRASFVGSEFRNNGAQAQEQARGYTQAITVRADGAGILGRGWTLEGGLLRARERMNEILREYAVVSGALRLRATRDLSPRTSLTSAWAQASRAGASGSVRAGLRVSDRTISDAPAVEPWLLAERRLGAVTLTTSTGGSAQFPQPQLLHAGGEAVGPERGWSTDAGVRGEAGRIEWSVTGFHRRESDVLRPASEARLDPVTHRRVFPSTFPEVSGTLDGSTRGIDLVVAHRAARGLTGWVGYTWSHTRMRDVRSGETFDGDFDQRHTLNAVAQYHWSPRTTAGASLRIGSNFPLVGYFEQTSGAMLLSSRRNGERLPLYARLDIRASRTFDVRRTRMTLFVEVLNVVGRRNLGPAEPVIRGSLEVVRFAERLVPRVPSAGLRIAF